MRTLALRGGARLAVVAADWRDAFGVVTRGRVQLELRDGEPGPVLGRDAGFWLKPARTRAAGTETEPRHAGSRTSASQIVVEGPVVDLAADAGQETVQAVDGVARRVVALVVVGEHDQTLVVVGALQHRGGAG